MSVPFSTTGDTSPISIGHYSQSLPLSPTSQSRRHSSRSIKRKKFDDELVESSILSKNNTRRSLDESVGTPICHTGISIDNPEKMAIQKISYDDQEQHSIIEINKQKIITTPKSIGSFSTNTLPNERKGMVDRRGNTNRRRKIKKTRQAFAAVKDMGRWKPVDDILLIDAVERLGDLNFVHIAQKFSCYFSLEEVQERWYALLYDPVISGLARQAMKTLPLEVVQATHAKAMFDKQEENILCGIPSTATPVEDDFKKLLEDNLETFHTARTPGALFKYWTLLKQYHLLPDQNVQSFPCGDHVLQLSDAEDLMDDQDLKTPKDEILDAELSLADKNRIVEIKKLEKEVQSWQTKVEDIIDEPNTLTVFDPQTIAVLRGRLVRYLMRSKEISFGRSTNRLTVDVDLSLEGPAFKVSRKQGTIKMKSNGDFILSNEGKRPIFVDGKPILHGSKIKLLNNAVVEISLLRFVFLINLNYIKSLGKKRDA